jgi:hypothetical protein
MVVSRVRFIAVSAICAGIVPVGVGLSKSVTVARRGIIGIRSLLIAGHGDGKWCNELQLRVSGSGGGVTRSNLINHNPGNLDHSEDGGKKDDKDG